ncbi:hypothetical protein APHAL10511_002586 [Amanita phalloides]|nr:hypothetical protein APHAL10511_002586 [Amanita phalloides]
MKAYIINNPGNWSKALKEKKQKSLEADKLLTPPEPEDSIPISLEKPEEKSFIRQVKHGWKGEEWKGDWGKDKLLPTARSTNVKRGRKEKPIKKQFPIAYTRRIEGLLEPLKKHVLTDVEPVYKQRPIANLGHGLDRVLFNPGVHWLQDPRSRVYNYTPWLETIPKVTDFAFERTSGFVKSSRDEELWTLLKRENRTFAGSTSSLSGILSQIYFLISGDKYVDTQNLSRSFLRESRRFTPAQRMPSTVFFNHQDGRYAIDSESGDTGFATKNILTWMGTMLEKHLTMSPDEFTSYMRTVSATEQNADSLKDAFRYAKSEQFVMRSQLDCQDSRLPGTGIFDIKTRACLPIRLDLLNFEEHSGYMIRKQHGLIESFEKEYYDLIRSAFLKYSFQARIGNMDGVFVAYHNTARIFGFQYIPLEEMDERLFSPSPGIGDRVFEKCIGLLEVICQEITQCFPGKSVKCTFETREYTQKLDVWVEPAEWDEKSERPIQQLQIQASNYIDLSQVWGKKAILACHSDDVKWSVHWTICRLSDHESRIRAALQNTKERQFRAFNFPTGVDESDMPEFWSGLNFGGREKELQVPYKMGNFRTASKLIENLRQLSRDSRKESDRIAEAEAGKPKVVYGAGMNVKVDQAALSSDGITTCAAYDFSDEGSLTEMADDAKNRIYTWASKYMPSWRKDARGATRPNDSTEDPNQFSNISRSSTITDDNQPSNPKRWSILSAPQNELDHPIPSVLDRPSSQQGPPSRASLSSRLSFSSMMGGLSSLALTRSMTKENTAINEDSRGRSLFRRRPESPSQTPITTENDAPSRTRSQSPFFFRRSRNLDPSPAPQAIPLAHSDGDLSDTSSVHPRLTSFTDDSDAETDAETEDEDETEENFFDTVTERNTERNALVMTDVQGVPDVEEPDPLGEGVNVVVPHEPYFPSTLDSREGSSRNKRNPKRRKSVKHEPLPLHTARPIFARDRCTTTLTQGDPKLDGRKGRRYMVASDLGEESRYALEWGIGTVLRDGDELLVVHILENENKIDPPIPNTADRALKLRCQQERQGFAFILVRQSTSLLQRTKLNVKVVCQAWHAKNARHMLLDIADYYEPTMLIVGSRGLGQLSGILLGSTSHYLIQKCSVPVMVARRRLKRPPKKSAHLVKNRAHISLAEAAAVDRVAAKVDTDVKSMHDQMQRAEEERHQERTTGLQPSLRETHPISEEDEAEDAEDEGDEGPQEIKVV